MGWSRNVGTCHIYEQNLGNQLVWLANSILASIFYVLELFHLNGFHKRRHVPLRECIFPDLCLSIKDLVLRNLSYTTCLYEESNGPTCIKIACFELIFRESSITEEGDDGVHQAWLNCDGSYLLWLVNTR